METRQKYWEGMAAGSFLLVATGAMMLVTLAVLDLAGSEIVNQLNGWGSLVALVLAGIGGLLLMVEAGNKAKAYLIIAKLKSSMASKNAFMMTAFMGLDFIYTTFFFKFIPWYGWDYIRAVVAVLGIIAALLAIMVPAFELGEARGRGFWNTGALIPTFFITSAVTGLGTVLLVAALLGLAGDASIMAMNGALLGFIVLQLLTVWGYVKGMEHSGAEEARRAAHNVLCGEFKNSFWGGVIVIGTIVPLIMYWFGGSPAIIIIKAILLLIGGACFRNIFLQAAVRKSLPGEEHEWGSREETAKLAAELEKRWQEKAVILFNK